MEERERPTEVLGALPHRRPSRRSAKRPSIQSDATKAPARTAPRSAGDARSRRPAPGSESGQVPSSGGAPPPEPESVRPSRAIMGTAVQAAAELAEIGISVSARAIREAVARLPKP